MLMVLASIVDVFICGIDIIRGVCFDATSSCVCDMCVGRWSCFGDDACM